MQYASWLGEELQVPVLSSEEVSSAKLFLYDFVVVAGSVYMGKWLLRDWLKEHLNILRNKKLFLLIVCATPSSEREKRKDILDANIPELFLRQSDVSFLPGRLTIKNLSWTDWIFLKIGTMLEKDPVRKNAMKHDLDGVSKKMLGDVISKVRAFLREKKNISRDLNVRMVEKK
jgi:menaquinone-dependent protoporphyrinogen IX oxidase